MENNSLSICLPVVFETDNFFSYPHNKIGCN